jgi:cysteinyl-tRNA synthetase
MPDRQKKHPADFALWFKTVGRFANHEMRWPSPWGEGFPGWHIECSAMSRKYLGQPFDVHTGGIDHTTIHHPNEIAQSEAAYDVPLANYWVHNEFLLVEGQKMSKSLGNLLTLDDLEKQGFSALDFKYLLLTSHYRNKINFTWEGLGASARAYANLRAEIEDYDPAADEPSQQYLERFTNALCNNLDTPTALSIVWELIKDSKLPSAVKRATVNKMDEVLALGLANLLPQPPSLEVQKLIKERDQARANQEWEKADKIRHIIEEYGYIVEDRPQGTKVRKKHKF